MKNISNLLKSKRIKLNKTLDDVAKECSVDKATISRWEKGEINSIKINKILPLANSLDIDPLTLISLSIEDNDVPPPLNTLISFTFYLKSLGYLVKENEEIIEPIFDEYGATYNTQKIFVISNNDISIQISENQINKLLDKNKNYIIKELNNLSTNKGDSTCEK